jgi:hypothetical protein
MKHRNRDIGIFVDVQDCSTPEEVVVAISMATRPHQKIWEKTTGIFKSFFGVLLDKIDEIDVDMIKLKIREGVSGDWQGKGARVLETLAGADLPVVLAMDELPVMINRLLRGKANRITDDSQHETSVFLSWLRNSMGKHQGRIRWIICGSIGLEPVLSQCNLNHTIGHLRSFPLNPWTRETADECLQALAAAHTELDLSATSRRDMLDLLGCNIPHHVQMFFGYLYGFCLMEGITSPTPDDVKTVYETSMLSTKGHAELADLEERLHRVLGAELVVLAMDLLTETAMTGVLTHENATLLAEFDKPLFAPMEPVKALRMVLGVLEHDGYLSPVNDAGYQFVSNLVRDWWKRRFQIGYVKARDRRR